MNILPVRNLTMNHVQNNVQTKNQNYFHKTNSISFGNSKNLRLKSIREAIASTQAKLSHDSERLAYMEAHTDKFNFSERSAWISSVSGEEDLLKKLNKLLNDVENAHSEAELQKLPILTRDNNGKFTIVKKGEQIYENMSTDPRSQAERGSFEANYWHYMGGN